MTADEIIEKFGLMPLMEEGGFFREVYRDKGSIPATYLTTHGGKRSYVSSIYYLLKPTEHGFSALHKVRSAEIFHFYAGDPVEFVQIDQNAELSKVTFGNNIEKNHSPQIIVPAGNWQGAKLMSGGSWALFGCTVAPGFELNDFQLGNRDKLCELYPQHAECIKSYTR